VRRCVAPLGVGPTAKFGCHSYTADNRRAKDGRDESLAILAAEHTEAAGKRLEVKVFATEDNLRKARDGIHPAAALAGFPPKRVRRFFQQLNGSFHIGKELRDSGVRGSEPTARGGHPRPDRPGRGHLAVRISQPCDLISKPLVWRKKAVL
jgi:hypothetical protein